MWRSGLGRPQGESAVSARDAAAVLLLARRDPVVATLLERLPGLALPECHLAAGCLFQAVWNARLSRPPGWGIRDYDICYFDDADLSWEAEDAAIRRLRAITQDLGATIELRNQARVHLWYPQRFGVPYPALRGARDGIDRYLVACTCLGVEVSTGALYAPDGFADLRAGILRVNGRNQQPALFLAKARSYRDRWPFLTIAGNA